MCPVAPAELEAHILTHPDVDDVCVVGIADEYSGQLPLAFVTLNPAAKNKLKSKTSTLDQMRLDIMKVRYYFLHNSESVFPNNFLTARLRP